MEKILQYVDGAIAALKQAWADQEQVRVALEQASGLPIWELAVIVVAVAIVIGLLANRGRFRSSKASLPAEMESPRQKLVEPATVGSENTDLPGDGGMQKSGGVAGAQQGGQTRELDGQLGDLLQRVDGMISDLGPDEEGLKSGISEARNALDGGAVDQAVTLLSALGAAETETGRTLRAQAEQRLKGAALARLIAGDLEMAANNLSAAAEHYRDAIEAVPSGNEALLAECLNKHGTAMYHSRNGQAAAISFRRAVKLVERAKGMNHPDVATALNNLAMVNFAEGEFGAAEPLYKRALDIDERALGPDANAVGTDLNNLALLYKKQKRLDEAEPLMRRALEIKRKLFDSGHPSLVKGLRNYAGVLRALGREKEAELFEAHADAPATKRETSDAVA